MSDALVREAWNEVDRLRAFIKSIEWDGSRVVGYDGFSVPACPACGGILPGVSVEWEESKKHYDHREDCKLVAALAPSKEQGR